MNDVVIETVGGEIENEISAAEADAMVSMFEGDGRYEIRRSWDRVAFCVAVAVKGRRLPFLGYMVPLI